MTHLDLELSADLIRALRRLARRHHGDDSDEAVSSTVEAAMEMRLRWMELAGEAGAAVEEPVTSWARDLDPTKEGDVSHLQEWLFRGGADGSEKRP